MLFADAASSGPLEYHGHSLTQRRVPEISAPLRIRLKTLNLRSKHVRALKFSVFTSNPASREVRRHWRMFVESIAGSIRQSDTDLSTAV